MSFREELVKLVNEGNSAKEKHIKDMNTPGGLHHAVVWLNERVKADYKGFLAKQILTDLNTNNEQKVARCHLDTLTEQVLSNEHRCQSSDKFLDALCEAKRAASCEMAVFLRPFVDETS